MIQFTFILFGGCLLTLRLWCVFSFDNFIVLLKSNASNTAFYVHGMLLSHKIRTLQAIDYAQKVCQKESQKLNTKHCLEILAHFALVNF